jgi:hypothetical protein
VQTTKFVAVVVWAKDAARPGPVLTGEWLDSVGALVSSYWWDMSGGRQSVTWRVHEPVELSQNQQEKDALSAADLVTAIRQAAADQGQAFGDDEHLVAIIDDENGGVGVTETDPVIDATYATQALICHEMGHFFQHLAGNLGTHADTYLGYQLVDYGDPTCIMGVEGGKWSYREAALVIAESADHEFVGPAMSPPMTVRTGWLDEGNPAAVQNITSSLPTNVQLDVWRGAPRPGYAGRPCVAIVDGLAPGGDRLYFALRSPRAGWDKGFQPAPGGPPDTASIVAYELTGAGATLNLGACPATRGSWMRLGMAPLRIDVADGGDTSVVIRASFDPWRNWSPIDTPGGQPVHKVAAIARLDTADLFVLAADQTVWTRPFRNGFWRDWTELAGATFAPTAGMAAATSSIDTIDVFVVGPDDRVWAKHCGPAGWDDGWVPLDTPGLDQSASLAATATSRDHVELFATDAEHRVVHWTVIGQVADGLEGLPPLPPVNSVAANTLGDGSVQLHAVTEGAGDGRLWSTRDQHGLWDQPWFNHGQTPLDPQAELAAVTEGSGTAFVMAADTPLYVRAFSAGWIGPAAGVDGLDLRPDCSLAAISRDLRSIDVFAVKPDGTLAAITRSPEVGASLIGAQSLRNYPALMVHNDTWFVSAQHLPLDSRLTLWANTQVPGPAERFTIHELQRITETVGDQQLIKTMVAIEAVNGKFLTAEKGGNNFVFARGEAVRDWEKWRLFPFPGNSTFTAIQSINGYYLSADGDGGGLVMCTGQRPERWERFIIA